MKHPLTDGVGPGEWVDDSKERRLVSLAEKRLVEAVARIAELEARNKNLEEALRQIAETNYKLGSFEALAKGIARAALSTEEDEK